MAAYWTNFARTGDPHGEGLPEWPVYSRARPSVQLIGDDASAGAIPNEAALQSIDRLYWTVRALLNYGVCIAGGAGLILVLLGWRITAFLFRRR